MYARDRRCGVQTELCRDAADELGRITRGKDRVVEETYRFARVGRKRRQSCRCGRSVKSPGDAQKSVVVFAGSRRRARNNIGGMCAHPHGWHIERLNAPECNGRRTGTNDAPEVNLLALREEDVLRDMGVGENNTARIDNDPGAGNGAKTAGARRAYDIHQRRARPLIDERERFGGE